MLSPRSVLISRLIAERNAARAQEATPGTSRTLTFEDAGSGSGCVVGGRRPAQGPPEGTSEPARARLGEVGADAFVGLRPAGEERADAARVMRELEAHAHGGRRGGRQHPGKSGRAAGRAHAVRVGWLEAGAACSGDRLARASRVGA
eukprot:5572260-Pleurochrysis_carterae.AAC.1